MRRHHFYIGWELASPSARFQKTVDKLKEAEKGIAINRIDPKILKKFKKRDMIQTTRCEYGSRYFPWNTLSITMVHLKDQVEAPEPRVAEPYKKRKAVMKEAGLKFRVS